jgi:hypothetical protein
MPPIVLGEYRDEHSQRSYPFTDAATLTDADGWTLPVDFIIDAFLYPIDLVNGLYLSRIDRTESKLYFCDTVTNKEHGVAIVSTADTAYVYEPDGLERQIGVITFGDSRISGLQGNLTRTFTPAATELLPTAYVPLNQEGTRAVKLTDGTVVTGAVRFRGTSGIKVLSYHEAGDAILEFSIVGVPPPPDEDCGGCPNITEICVVRMPGSALMVSQYDDSTLAIDAYDLDLGDICAKQKLQRLPDDEGNMPPDGDDPCDDPTEPEVPTAGPLVEFCFDVTTMPNSTFNVITPSSGGDRNPLHLQSWYNFAFRGNQRLRVPVRPVGNLDDITKLVEDFRDPPDLGDALQVGFKGLALYRRPRHA